MYISKVWLVVGAIIAIFVIAFKPSLPSWPKSWPPWPSDWFGGSTPGIIDEYFPNKQKIPLKRKINGIKLNSGKKLPVVLHEVKKGQTLRDIAQSYGVQNKKNVFRWNGENWARKTQTVVRPGDLLAMRSQPYYALASWYGPGFHRQRMANGEIYNQWDETVVAHKTLPFGTKVLTINPDNDKKIVLTVKDRGPFIPGREYDLSLGAAEKLGMSIEGVKELAFIVLWTPGSKKSVTR
ncbi:MAG: hypothetical protein COU46_01495 [Candidatus Niyogibacteria bacterium CG10_big_fil_rev_8_21_14_0_10_42_19]|uniref:RlpA-like protein double-psi beta-barrel domain-containing protein n=1 Tax=Candidatus Niyogibacteria bacterium CG10_big_fil_rev_8_21_14_0_10_42_19 TaxID=1974725 RepID=A0A2H0TI26_9BACT|nr:MAG: hypothetical protein COU46_01495 [Candidatus Niyogibacteria bacterium CG10_big_fil_rev_8_21_14_0_10_42_19]